VYLFCKLFIPDLICITKNVSSIQHNLIYKYQLLKINNNRNYENIIKIKFTSLFVKIKVYMNITKFLLLNMPTNGMTCKMTA